eukprot:jgi/Antlo1/666/1185
MSVIMGFCKSKPYVSVENCKIQQNILPFSIGTQCLCLQSIAST